MKTSKETLAAMVDAGDAKVRMTRGRLPALFVSAMLAGAFIAMGGTLALICSGGLGSAASGNPSLPRIVSGATFPLGLILVVAVGVELFTGNNATLIPAYMKRRYSAMDVLRNWTVVYFGNMAGAVAFTYLLVYATGLVDAEPYRQAAVGIGVAKTSMPWLTVMLKGIGANWLVCLAVWMAMGARSFPGKALACWLPVMAFVTLGFEHSVANMFYLPIALMQGAPFTVGTAVTANLIPATIGNIIGGALFVGCTHYYLLRD